MATNKRYGECLMREWRTVVRQALQVVREAMKVQIRSGFDVEGL
jgi:hypothetical protein